MANSSENITPLRKTLGCPNCGQPSQRKSYPFCSSRCADVDLNRWFSGNYRIPVEEKNDNFDDFSEQ